MRHGRDSIIFGATGMVSGTRALANHLYLADYDVRLLRREVRRVPIPCGVADQAKMADMIPMNLDDDIAAAARLHIIDEDVNAVEHGGEIDRSRFAETRRG
jgi:hypothetical protein